MFSLSTSPLDIVGLENQLKDARAGGYASFEGWVRNHNEGREVLRLEYEAYEAVAVREAAVIIEEAKLRFGVYDAACVHRVGELAIGDIAVWVGVSSAHRGEAFDACRYIIDEVKHRLPIWKKEHYTDGDSGWVNCERCAADHGHHHHHADEPCTDSDANASEKSITAITENQFYARQMRLPEVGAKGQEKLRTARVLVVGAGGLGCPALQYLAAAGVGTIGICDGDRVDASNLHRQPLYAPEDIGAFKAERAAAWLKKQNPFIQVKVYTEHLDVKNVDGVLAEYDIVLDCTDNFETKYLLNDAAVRMNKTFILSSIYQYEGQLFVYDPLSESACLRCLWPEMPDPNCVGTCADVGVLGALPGIFGAYQAMEALKHILGLDGALKNAIVYMDLLSFKPRRIPVLRSDNCPVCGNAKGTSSFPVPDFSDIEIENPETLGEFQWVDMRDANERDDGDFPVDALKISVNTLAENTESLNAGKVYVLVCPRGMRSKYLAHKLRKQGYGRVYSLKGGIVQLNALLKSRVQ